MKTIQAPIVSEQVIQKSKFISYLFVVDSEAQAREYLSEIKKQHPKANHHCFAMVIDEIVRSNDDGEPASSAGVPMLQILQANQLNYVLAIVVRYFGGIKLGVGGLIRAYSSSVQLALEEAVILEKTIVREVDVAIDFDQLSIVETQLNEKAIILDRSYSDKAHFKLEVYQLDILEELTNLSSGRLEIIDNKPVEKWLETKTNQEVVE